MDKETEKIIKTQIENLPTEVKALLTDPEIGNKILNIGKKNGITNIEQLGIFQMETNLMILGLVHPDEYPDELKNRLKIDSEKVNNIIKNINEQILVGIREKLKEVYEKTNEISEDTSGQPTENREEIQRVITNNDKESTHPIKPPEESKEIDSISEQKFSGSFQIPSVETEHSLNNMTKDASTSIKIPKVEIPKVDPYRELPE